MFFLPNTTSFAWSVLMPVWEWQVDELPPETFLDALDSVMDAMAQTSDPGLEEAAPGVEAEEAEPGLPPGSTLLQAVALALAGVVADAESEPAQPPARGPAPLPPPVPGLALAAVLQSTAKPVPKATAAAAVPQPISGRWVLSGWREQSSYSLYRNPPAERAAEQPAREDLEHVLVSARQRRKPDCGQP